jgi:hypothetical protein
LANGGAAGLALLELAAEMLADFADHRPHPEPGEKSPSVPVPAPIPNQPLQQEKKAGWRP